LRLFDTHTHLTDAAFDEDRDAVLERAGAAGVERLVAVGTDLPSSRDAVHLARTRPRVVATAGVHPHEASSAGDPWGELESIWDSGAVAAVGEVGLDGYYDHAPMETQCAVFERSVDAACRHGLPLVVHCRDAHAQLWDVLEASGNRLAAIGPCPGVMHSFSGDRAALDRALSLGFMVSFAGIVTFRNADDVRDVAAAVPEDRLLSETDCPYLAPVPRRGRRNEPAFVRHVVDKLAEIRGERPDVLAKHLWENAKALFGAGLEGHEPRAGAS
jgi:TatD DNase family protein